MERTILKVKNMVCPRCIKVVSDELKKMGFGINEIQLGTVEMGGTISIEDIAKIRIMLFSNGFELLDDKKLKIIEKIKILIIDAIMEDKFSGMETNLSEYISETIQMEYTNLSTMFSSVEGRSIERFVILQKIERVKELITYNELSVKEISIQLGYSSLQALSNQFKKETGMTPTEFKKLTNGIDRKPISEL